MHGAGWFPTTGWTGQKVASAPLGPNELNNMAQPPGSPGVLYFIEQGYGEDAKTDALGSARRSEIPLLAIFQDFDWADEGVPHGGPRLVCEGNSPHHNHKGRSNWTKGLGSILPGARGLYGRGLTRNKKWWPEFYRQLRRVLGGIRPPACRPTRNADLEPG